MTEYLKKADERRAAIINNTDQKFYFESQSINSIPNIDRYKLENYVTIHMPGASMSEPTVAQYVNAQRNDWGAQVVRQTESTINDAALRYGVDADLVKAIIYTEVSRGWYGYFFELINIGSTILPGNIDESWEVLIPGSDVTNISDNIELTTKLIAEISERLDDPSVENVYALYNSLSHDRTYTNEKTKLTPYFARRAYEDKAWNTDDWQLLELKQAHCFISGTPILVEKYEYRSIEIIKVGDKVISFDERGGFNQSLEKRRVTRIFTNITCSLVDLRGLICTPGHAFLTGDVDSRGHGKFATVARILRDDRTIVDQDGTVIRARTGAKLGTDRDALVSLIYRERSPADTLRVERRALVRAGIPMPATALGEGAFSAQAGTLAQHLEAHGITILPDGRLRTSDGILYAACNWPEGATPFDTHEARNWIVEADGEPYTPPWIRDLVEGDEVQGLRVVGAVPTVSGTVSITSRPL